MHTADRTILVTGATGRQGGAAARHLLADGWRVRALVRDPDAPAARALRRAGAELVTGDLDDVASLRAAVTGAHGVFGVTPDDRTGLREVAWGRNLAEAAAEAGVRHYVFTSVGGAERHAEQPAGFAAKWSVEQHVRRLGLPATILRPVRFMENHAIPGLPMGGIVDGVLLHIFRPDVPVQLIAVDDIGAVAALAFAHPEEYLGEAIELAGDELTPEETVKLIGRALGRQVRYRQLPLEEAAAIMPGIERAYAFLYEGGGWQADIPALRKRHPGLMDFPTWLQRGGAAAIEALWAGRDGAEG
ncbi:NmrA/HSCARG family protein [Allostreptomyces psammosilenae]|uniref:Uncharacterized protein YbjT (DUF2867 family) n=1 Tax=Allostreptomyces psammosilenae TaxID=1892865 RepID=A0A853A1R0_9ACTN|nr:NmrA/HSCARG family protein [Allostreptomyces psammosilenae]NYI06844.1 uncharacterized protein YbjT (DUF2867 family) [Allostreptomyces psammosilenae]